MKNIHVLPTEKASKLIKQTNGKLRLSEITFKGQIASGVTQNIYITSNEEIKEGDWCVELNLGGKITEVFKCKGMLSPESIIKKIILTTDLDLIVGGVQAINDEFLEWFVKNPSCENVEVLKCPIEGAYTLDIPKEELTKCYCGHTTTCDCGPEEPKQEDMITKIMQMDAKMAYDSLPKQNKQMTQETLEEAANKLLWKKYPYHPPKDAGYWKDVFKEGAKWQQERSYSEEEVKKLIIDFLFTKGIGKEVGSVNEWFERNKKQIK